MGLVKEAKRWSIASLYNQCGTGRDYVLITGFWNYIRWAIEIWSPVKENAFILDSCWLIILNIQQNTMDVVSLKFDFWRNLLEIESKQYLLLEIQSRKFLLLEIEQKISSEFKSQWDYSKWHDFPKHHIYWYFFTLILCITSQ